MHPWLEATDVRGVEVLRDQESLLGLTRRPDLVVRTPAEAFIERGIDVEAHRRESTLRGCGDVLIKLQLHATLTSGGSGEGAGKSSLADAAANAITARTSSSVRLGNSRRIVDTGSP